MSGHKIRGAFWVVFFSFLTFPHLLFAAPAGVPTTFQQLYDALCRLTNWLFAFILAIAVIAFLSAGFLFFFGGGSSEKVTKARQLLIYAIIGTAIAVLARAFVIIIGQVLGANVGGVLNFAC